MVRAVMGNGIGWSKTGNGHRNALFTRWTYRTLRHKGQVGGFNRTKNLRLAVGTYRLGEYPPGETYNFTILQGLRR